MWRIFTPQSPYRKRARLPAILWTLLIFILCLWPAKELPEVGVPLADKWTHMVLFAVFSFGWACVQPASGAGYRMLICLISIALGWLVEWLQQLFPTLGRNFDYKDIVANGIGGLLGVLLFYTMSRIAKRKAVAA